jgi:uncharacterized repeat protein (TIGR03847 family)
VVIDLDPVDRITADAVGEPGQRAFYLQARKGDQLVTLLVEKQQVQLLAASVVEILSRLGQETGAGPEEEAMGLEQPVDPEWRAGRLSIGYEEDRDLILLEVEELLPEDEDEDDEDELGALAIELEAAELPGSEEELDGEHDDTDWDEDLEELEELEQLEGLAALEADEPALEPGKARFWATREQMLSMARHGASVCAQGRPRCQLCGNPIDPEGHRCPALNGHREASE